MTAYQALLDLARQQTAALERGDLDGAVALLDPRAELLAQAPVATLADHPDIQQVLLLDRHLSGAIRERMLKLRDEALAAARGGSALSGYRPGQSGARLLDEIG
jgi:hypothetical protein